MEKDVLMKLIECYECLTRITNTIAPIFECNPLGDFNRINRNIDDLIISNCIVGKECLSSDEYDAYYEIIDNENLTSVQKYMSLMNMQGDVK